MKHAEMETFARSLAPVVREFVTRETVALRERLAAIEARAPVPGPSGDRGEKGEPGEPGPQGEPGRDGADADNEAIAARLLPEIERAVAQLPPAPAGPQGEKGDPGERGRDADPADVVPLVLEQMPAPVPGPRGEKGEPGPAGRDADPAAVVPLVLEQMPPPERGERGERGEPGPRGEKGDTGADGVGIADLLIDRKGALVVTMQDGRILERGIVVGKDGEPGPAGKDGRDGKDALGFDDLSVTHDGHRTFTFAFQRGAEVKQFPFTLPVVLDCGVYRPDTAYKAGDGVTYAGCFWIAQRDTSAKPEPGDEWRLSVKRGRDGKVPDVDDLAEKLLPKLAQKLAPVIRKAIDDAMTKGPGGA